MPYVCMTTSGMPPGFAPQDIDQWGYFYAVSWRPGVSVRALVAEDAQPVGYWFFDDPYGHQFGNGPQGDLAGDVKMNYGGGVFRDTASGVTHYGGYASMLVLIDGDDPRGARVLPPFDGLLPGSPPCGPLLQLGGERYDAFLTFGALAPGALLEVGDRIGMGGAIWPPVEGAVEFEIVTPSGKISRHQVASDPLGTFSFAGFVAEEPGVWKISAEAVCSGKTSAGTIREQVPPEQWPRGGAIGLPDKAFSLPVTMPGAPGIAFDMPSGSRANPPLPLVIRGHLPPGNDSRQVHFLVALPGQVVARGVTDVHGGLFEYIYEPQALRQRFPNIDTRIEMPAGGYENQPAWFDTVTFTFWAGQGRSLSAGTVLLQGEQLYAPSTDSPLPLVPSESFLMRQRDGTDLKEAAAAPVREAGTIAGSADPASGRPVWSAEASSVASDMPLGQGGSVGPKNHNSLLTLSSDGNVLYAAHPWSGEVVRMGVLALHADIQMRAQTGGQPACVALAGDEKTLYVTLADRAEVLLLSAATFEEMQRFAVGAEPRATVPSADGQALYVADFSADCVLRISPSTGQVEAASDHIDRPACLAVSPKGDEVYTVSFRTGEIVVLDPWCKVVRRFGVTDQLNQCRTLTLADDGLLFAPQTRSDTFTGGRMFDRSVFPVIVVADPRGRVSRRYSPDLLVVPPHRGAEVAVDEKSVFLASAGSDDLLTIDRVTGFARWHRRRVGMEPGAIALDGQRERLYVLTITGQEIITLGALTGVELARVRFTEDPTPAAIARTVSVRDCHGQAIDKGPVDVVRRLSSRR